MRILSVTAQRPDSTGSGVYLTELVRAFAANGHEQAVIAGVGAEDVPVLPEGVPCYAVHYGTEALPYPILGMSDQMPYPSTPGRESISCGRFPSLTGSSPFTRRKSRKLHRYFPSLPNRSA